MDGEPSHVVVVVSAPNAGEAWVIAKALVERKLAACVQTFPIRSCYEWEGKIVEDNEVLIFIKSRREVFAQLEACVMEHTSYEVPEIVALPIVQGSEKYLRWLDNVVRS
ncbi:MAG TPA: divalent-cation tolerance protein CutA [Anaerolineae bacterium]